MAKDKKVLVEDLKLSSETKEYLTLSGIDTLEDFNTFTLKELRLLLKTEAAFDEVAANVLKKYQLPVLVENLALSKELESALEEINISETKALLALNAEQLHDVIAHDGLLYDELEVIYAMYGVNMPDKSELVHHHEHVEATLVEEEVNAPISVDAFVKAALLKPKPKTYG